MPDDWNDIKRKHAERAAIVLAQRKAEATERGKEPFDLEKLEAMCDTTNEGRLEPLDERRARFEYMYYVEHPAFMTLVELADLITLVSRY